MPGVHRCELPEAALLRGYLGAGSYADCYVLDIARSVSHSEYVEAFYTTAVFKVERFLLRWLASRPSTDTEARELAQGSRDTFAAWRVENRGPDQLLLADFTGRTRSWLMIERGAASGTRLYFGSAVVPLRRASKTTALGFPFRALLGFHKLYSRILLLVASIKLRKKGEQDR